MKANDKKAKVLSRTCRTCKFAKVWSDGCARCNLEWRLWTADTHTCSCYKPSDGVIQFSLIHHLTRL